MLLAIVPAAPPTRKNQRATSCPAPISANVPYLASSRLIRTAFWCVSRRLDCIACPLPGAGRRARSRPIGADASRRTGRPRRSVDDRLHHGRLEIPVDVPARRLDQEDGDELLGRV